MKITVFIVILLMFVANLLIDQDDIETKITKIREEYNKVELNLKNCKKKLFTYPAEDGESEMKFEAYYLPYGQLVKLIAIFNFKSCERHIEYCCKADAVIFMFIQDKRQDGTQVQERVYFDDNHKVIRDLIKEKKIDDKRDFSKISNENAPEQWSDLSELPGYAFYGNWIIERYLSYPVFEVCYDVDLKMKQIREEYDKIESNRQSGALKEYSIYYTDSVAYWNNTHYTAFYDEQSNLVLLTYSIGEEGYYGNYEISFKDRKPFFILSTSGEPDGKESQGRIYIYNDRIINALIKEKSPDQTLDFSQIENKTDNSIMDNVNNSNSGYSSDGNLRGVGYELCKLYKGFEAEKDN